MQVTNETTLYDKMNIIKLAVTLVELMILELAFWHYNDVMSFYVTFCSLISYKLRV